MLVDLIFIDFVGIEVDLVQWTFARKTVETGHIVGVAPHHELTGRHRHHGADHRRIEPRFGVELPDWPGRTHAIRPDSDYLPIVGVYPL